LRLWLLVAQPEIADDQHVRIVPLKYFNENLWREFFFSRESSELTVTGSSVGDNVILIVAIVVDDALKRSPRVLDVIEISPQIAVLDDWWEIWLWMRMVVIITEMKKIDQLFSTHADAGIDLINGPAAAVNHRSTSSIEMASKLGISLDENGVMITCIAKNFHTYHIHVGGQRVAAVQFNIIDVPWGKLLRILLRGSKNAGVSSARVVTIIFVDAKLETFRMNLQLSTLMSDREPAVFSWHVIT
jgi:hypothetical protein